MSFSSVSEAYRQQQEENLKKYILWSLIASAGIHVALLPLSLNFIQKAAFSEEAIEFIVVEETPPEVKEPAPKPEAAKPEIPEPEPTPEPEATPEPEPVKAEQPEPIQQPEPVAPAPLGTTQQTPPPEQTVRQSSSSAPPVETPKTNEPVTPPVSPPQSRTEPTNPLDNITPPNTPPETTEPLKDTTPEERPVPPESSRSEAPAPPPIRNEQPGNSNPQDLFNDPGNPTEPTTPSEPNPTSTGSNEGGIDMSDPFDGDSGSDAPVAPNVTPITPSSEGSTGELFGETPDIASNPGSSEFDPGSSIGGNDGGINAGDPFDGSSGAMDNSPLGSEPVAPISPGGGSSGGEVFDEGDSYDMAGNPGGSYDPGSTSSFGGDGGIGESDGFGDSVGPMSGLPPAGDPAGDPTSTRGSGPPTCFNCDDDPIYPPRAVENGWEGQVQVSFTVNPDGSVSNVTVISPSSYEELNQAAIETAYNFQFSPSDNGILNHSLGIRFKLNGRGGGFGSY